MITYMKMTRRRTAVQLYADHSSVPMISLSASKSRWFQNERDLINAKPEIADFIRVLIVDHDINIGVRTAWFANDRFLPSLLNALHHLRLFLLRLPYILPWFSLSIEMRSALLDRFRSSALVDVELYQLVHLPMSMSL